MKDIAAMIHKAAYGHSDKANAPENQTEEFKRGYADGLTETETDELIEREWTRIGQPSHEIQSFREYKRGMWAAKMQSTVAKALAGS
jgi:hypothetical protein